MILSSCFPEQWIISFSRSGAADRKSDVLSSSGPQVENNAVANYFRQNKVNSSCCVEGCLWPVRVVCHAAHEQEKQKDAGSAVFRKQQGKLHQNTFMRVINGKWWKLDTNSSALTSVRREESSTNPHTTGKQLHCSEASWTVLACEDLALGLSPTEQHTLSLIPRESLQEKEEKASNHYRHGKKASRWPWLRRAQLVEVRLVVSWNTGQFPKQQHKGLHNLPKSKPMLLQLLSSVLNTLFLNTTPLFICRICWIRLMGGEMEVYSVTGTPIISSLASARTHTCTH